MKWFKHMCDASENDFLTRLEDEFGLEGYARWFKLCEAVGHGADPKKDKWSVAHPWSKWQSILKGKRKKLETFLEHSEIVSRTNQKLIGNILEIEIPKLKELKDNYAKDLQAAGNSTRARVPDTEAEEEGERAKALSTDNSAESSGHRPSQCPPEQWDKYVAYSRQFLDRQHQAWGPLVKITESKVQAGAKALDNLIRVQGFPKRTVQETIEWAMADDFWSQQLRSLGSLTKKSKNDELKFSNILAKRAEEVRRAQRNAA